jgi:hypothetical protein
LAEFLRRLCFNFFRLTRLQVAGLKVWVRQTGGIPVNAIKLVAFALIVAGTLGLVYGGFSYTKDTTAIKLGPLELSVKEKETVNVPVWAGIGAIVIGGVLLVMGSKKG